MRQRSSEITAEAAKCRQEIDRRIKILELMGENFKEQKDQVKLGALKSMLESAKSSAFDRLVGFDTLISSPEYKAIYDSWDKRERQALEQKRRQQQRKINPETPLRERSYISLSTEKVPSISLLLQKSVAQGLRQELDLLHKRYGIQANNYDIDEKRDNLATIYVKKACASLSDFIRLLPQMTLDDLALQLRYQKTMLEGLKPAIKFSKQTIPKKGLITRAKALFFTHFSNRKPGQVIGKLMEKVRAESKDAEMNKAETAKRAASIHKLN